MKRQMILPTYNDEIREWNEHSASRRTFVRRFLAILAFLAVIAAAITAFSGDMRVTLEWDRNPETNVIGYLVYTGNTSRDYFSVTNVGNITLADVRGLDAGTNWYFAVVAMTSRGLTSEFSNEVLVAIPPKPQPTVIRDAQWHPPQIPLVIQLEFAPLITNMPASTTIQVR